ncbi:hypothetical protein sscle_07g056670 [Sclerotinia sclerotiorum 1980 UF-70]|uniref:Zn(2)-C6 fungal-type domain-containing protein n=1 Tax=Sclerotinia sclerotiorum (strain ATCC 18683 / 1980 / Ss-1) TaxID=665079 RepID=A0A1D9Q7J5_SCLS1|nr:hypothetical protein sscle_07g056670 [Sclerotinia sclerotiorum 1980 UF-70]
MNQSEEKPPGQKVSKVSCERCRYRRIRCDRMQPCPACRKGNHECVYPQSEKSRPVPKGYVQALEGQIASLELFITKLIAANASKRDEMLANFSASTNHLSPQTKQSSTSPKPNPLDTPNISIRPRTGHLRKLKDGNSAEFYGATSFFQINPSEYLDDTTTSTLLQQSEITSPILTQTSIITGGSMQEHLAFAPRSDICKYLMRIFFRHQYQYHMCLYREYFLRDFDAGTGPYYSDLLMYAICSMGALASESTTQRELSDMFSNRAQELLYGYALEFPNLTTLQALILLGHREIGHGKTSKGWLFSGMAFRIAHEMGLHLDPTNWKGSNNSWIDREILRRTYWAAFVADKQLSLYFGRPPALYPGESDVHDTVRIPYPPEWKSLLNKYIMPGTSETAYEDGLTLVASWVHQIELCKILHGMITKVFENRNLNTDPTILATSIREVDVALTKWLKNLPAKLQWTKWSVADVPPFVLHLHMQYHTAMIILHRPPRAAFKEPGIGETEDVQICYESLDIIMKLLRMHSNNLQNYPYRHLPITFVHTLASAASIILMRRYIKGSSWKEPIVSRALDQILEAVNGVSLTWTCANQIRDVITSAIKKPSAEDPQNASPKDFDLMAGLIDPGVDSTASLDGVDWDSLAMNDTDFEIFMGNDFAVDFSTCSDGSFPQI